MLTWLLLHLRFLLLLFLLLEFLLRSFDHVSDHLRKLEIMQLPRPLLELKLFIFADSFAMLESHQGEELEQFGLHVLVSKRL